MPNANNHSQNAEIAYYPNRTFILCVKYRKNIQILNFKSTLKSNGKTSRTSKIEVMKYAISQDIGHALYD